MFLKFEMFRHFHYLDWLFPQCFSYLLLYNRIILKLSGLKKQPNILLLMICILGIWAGLSGDSFSLPHDIGWAAPLGLENERWPHFNVWGLGISC